MIRKPTIGAILALAVGFTATATSTYAGSKAAKEEVVIVEEEKPAFSGWLSFDLNSHFISYGSDVWGGGTSWGKGTFNPSAELSWASPIPGLSAIVGSWWDVNNNAPSPIGGRLQEVDIWTGLSYAYKDLSATVLYQAWMYGASTEQILDVIFKYNNNLFLNPTFKVHNRLYPGASGGSNGTFFVPSISYSFSVWKVNLSPYAEMGFCTDGFQKGGGGYAYTTIGIAASIPITFLPGSWDLHGGVAYFNTYDEVIPNNPASNFVTGNIGVKLSF